MSAAAARLDPGLMRDLADHYARLPGLVDDRFSAAPEAATDADIDAARAQRIILHGLPERDLPACAKCHAPDKRPDYPRLTGQKASYLAARLRHWRGDPAIVEARQPNDSMAVIARRIPEDMIEPLARRHAGQ